MEIIKNHDENASDYKNREKSIKNLEDEIINCKKCDLYRSRTKPLTCIGNLDADIMLIGEAPGYNEDLTGKPFIGKAGKLLDTLLASISLERKDTYITSIVKCRPPSNKDPAPEQINACKPYLDRQLSIIHPKIIIPLGRFACAFIFEKYGLGKERISQTELINVAGKDGMKLTKRMVNYYINLNLLPKPVKTIDKSVSDSEKAQNLFDLRHAIFMSEILKKKKLFGFSKISQMKSILGGGRYTLYEELMFLKNYIYV